MSTFYIREGDTLPPLDAVLKDETGTAINLAGGAVYLVINGAQHAGSIVDEPTGRVTFSFSSVSLTAGKYPAYWLIDWGAGQQSVPNYEEFHIVVRGDLTV